MNQTFQRLASVGKKQSTKSRKWFYQFPSDKSPRQIIQKGKWWHYTTWPGDHGNDQSSNTLEGAKGDLKFAGAKVWSELI